ncbi:presenilins-associated rhomboid-like protein, mitochondrial isoform X1 [Rhinatrema bivittatum]|uniref:presenilins-associated rhomboid-like protein, mitochondrial isoform X1 n=1 Tax=Rhinatrema bivittatum TaxID=194408 RepID=UPI001127DF7F|nr:presenilins-associated rhomboid-like protein, mitochondrial isoform X1 [Rhinatrema bivittatum]
MAWVCCALRARMLLCRSCGGGGVSEHRFTIYAQQRKGFRRAPKKTEARKPEPKNGGETYRSSMSPSVPEPVFHAASVSFKRLFKPFLFTVGFTGCAFGSAAIWQYESLKSRIQRYFDELRVDWMEKLQPQKKGDFRKQVNQWWNSLTEGQRAVTGIIAANFLVFCLWRVPSMQRTMIRYFLSNPGSRTLCVPMSLSTFSHFSLFHMMANMYVLWSFSSSIVSLLGREQFLAVYLSAADIQVTKNVQSAEGLQPTRKPRTILDSKNDSNSNESELDPKYGVISTFVSYVCKIATGRIGPSLGASGAIMTVLAAVCTKMPEAQLAIILLPMFTFTAGNALKAILALDTAGLILGWKFFDHAAHLGGALFGIWYVTYGYDIIWKNREPLVKIWHEMRTKTPGKGGKS